MPDPPHPKSRDHPYQNSRLLGLDRRMAFGPTVAYAELAVTSNFTFLTGASHPDEMVVRAAEYGYRAIAVTDVNTLAGVVRAHVAAREIGIPLLVGCRLRLLDADGFDICVYATDRPSYGRLCRLLTLGKRRATKGQCDLTLADLYAHQDDMLAVILPRRPATDDDLECYARLRDVFDYDRLSLALARLFEPDDTRLNESALAASRRFAIPLVAVNDVHYHDPARKALQDVVTCIRHGCTLHDAGYRLHANGERYLKPPDEMARLFQDYPEAVERSVQIAERATGFSLASLRYEYPDEVCPEHTSPMAHLKTLVWEGAKQRYPDGVSEKVCRDIEHEFSLIEELKYAPYFLTVHDLVCFARSRGILCQGRGAAANSAVCYCLGVTSVNPAQIDILFERFVSRERDEPPDIDIDFEHERREEVIQYIYNKYSRERAGLTAVVITYRARSAVREVGKALGLSLDAVDRLAKRIHHWASSAFDKDENGSAGLRELGFDPNDRTIANLIRLTREIIGFPRHLSQHVGGFVITRGPLCELVPIENAAMPDRTIIEWDKDDIEAMGMLKVDCLGLGMLTCVRKALDMIGAHHGRELTLATIPNEDPAVYDMMRQADTVGVFQIESRAQMTMLPRLKPRCFYDLVIEVAIVRPGPIVGDMVHPYLRRRNGEESPFYPDEKVKEVLQKTLGVPLFQEQAMALAVVAAGFTPGEAELLRRAITAWKSRDAISKWPQRFIDGMLNNGYDRAFAEQCFARLRGFSEYGFPESHAASFALIVYASAWIKHYYPAAFAAALINSQPMGFYAPAQIVRDAKDHGVSTRSVDVQLSDWDCTLEDKGQVVRLGMRMVKGLREDEAQAIVDTVRSEGPFNNILQLWRRSEVLASSLRLLAQADAFGSMGLTRQEALWQIQKLDGRPLPLFDGVLDKEPSQKAKLPAVPAVLEVGRDYARTGLSLKDHPVKFFRDELNKRGAITAQQMKDESQTPHGTRASIGGIVLFRQRPGTAKGVLFITVEDETGRADMIVRPRIYEQNKATVFHSKALLVHGRVERQGIVVHVLPEQIEDIGGWFEELVTTSRDFR